MWLMFTDFTRAVTDPKISRGVTRRGRDHTATVKLALVGLIKSDTSWAFQTAVSSLSRDSSAVEGDAGWAQSQTFSTSTERGTSLTVLQGERGAVHRLALGRRSARRVGRGAGAVDAAAEAGAQLQAPHVADHRRGVEGLLWRQETSVKTLVFSCKAKECYV